MSGSTTYIFYAIDKPLSLAQRDEVRELSRRAEPTARRVDFWYNVDGYDLPATYESLMAKYYDIMVRQDYELWTLGMAWPYSRALYKALKSFECNDGEGCGVRVEPIDAKHKPGGRRIAKPTRLLAEISAFLDYEALETIAKAPRNQSLNRSLAYFGLEFAMSAQLSVAQILREHVTLEVECLDRMYLNVYVPALQHAGGVVRFFHHLAASHSPRRL